MAVAKTPQNAKAKAAAEAKKQAAETKRLRNPITGGAPNTFTKVEGATLSNPVNSQMPAPETDPYIAMTQKRSRTRAKTYADQRVGRQLTDIPVYGKVDMDEVGWRVEGSAMRGLMGLSGNSGTPNVTSGPAINEPHAAQEDVPVSRRAEDLSGPEHRAATAKFAAYGVTEESAVRGIHDANDRGNMRAILTGESTPAGSGFYGGPSKPHTRMRQTTSLVVSHPNYKGTPEKAWTLTAVANSDTSPKAKFEQMYKDGRPSTYPNAAAAETALMHTLGGGEPESVPKAPHGGIHKNTVTAAANAAKIMTGTPVSDLFPWDTSTKTRSYVSAHISSSNPDSYRTSDVLSTQSTMPHLDTRKKHKFNIQGPDGSPLMTTGKSPAPITHQFEAEDVGKDGLPTPKVARQRLAHHGFEGHTYVPSMKDGKPQRGGAPTEDLLNRSGAPGHALLDRAGRVAAQKAGKTPSVNHAQAQNQMQEIDWRDRQILRTDQPNTIETEHPGGLARMGMVDSASVWDHKSWPSVGQQFRGTN